MFLKVGHSFVSGFFVLKALYNNELYLLVKNIGEFVVFLCIKKHISA